MVLVQCAWCLLVRLVRCLKLGDHPYWESFVANSFLLLILFWFSLVPRFPLVSFYLNYFYTMGCIIFPFYCWVGCYRWISRSKEASAVVISGFPFFVSLFVAYIEMFSYFVRPFITIIRPLLNVACTFYVFQWIFSAANVWPLISVVQDSPVSFVGFTAYVGGFLDSCVVSFVLLLSFFGIWLYEVLILVIQWFIIYTLASLDLLYVSL